MGPKAGLWGRTLRHCLHRPSTKAQAQPMFATSHLSTSGQETHHNSMQQIIPARRPHGRNLILRRTCVNKSSEKHVLTNPLKRALYVNKSSEEHVLTNPPKHTSEDLLTSLALHVNESSEARFGGFINITFHVCCEACQKEGCARLQHGEASQAGISS